DCPTSEEIPLFQRPCEVVSHGSSAWARSYRIDTNCENGDEESFFMKVSTGDHGREALKGEFESTSAIHAIVGDFAPKPIKWGSFKSISNTHYYLCKFYELAEELPEPKDFCAKVAALHANSVSPNGKFGFHVVTYNGDLPQENGYTDTWEECFKNGFEHMLNMNIKRGGPWDEMECLKSNMLEKVIPRLLRPLETRGRSVKPALVHGDLWCGNVAIDTQTDIPLIYDPSSFYAHNEYELGNWRPERNKFSRSYFNAYHTHMPKAEPEDDYDDRNALYSMRFNLHAAALFPKLTNFRTMCTDEMKRLGLPMNFKVNGVSIPALGLGTFQGDDSDSSVKETVLNALRKGYRHIDTAAAYGNEQQVGDAIKESRLPRRELFITTKLAQTCHDPTDVEGALDLSLSLLQLQYVDLYLMHFPHAYSIGPNHTTLRHPNGKPVIDRDLSRRYTQTWTAMEKLVEKGKAKLIGLSNFNILKTKRVLETARIRPAVNQIEMHPYLPQLDLLEYCQRESIHVMAHQPLGGRPVAVVNPNANLSGPLLDPDIATAYKKSSAQVLLSWAVQRGTSTIPKTVREERLIENRGVFRLSGEDMDLITGLANAKGAIRFLDPKGHIGFDIFDEVKDEPILD
ncbi:hypothetical protein EV356DRAFT_450641, partial [Viridothelium virens]